MSCVPAVLMGALGDHAGGLTVVILLASILIGWILLGPDERPSRRLVRIIRAIRGVGRRR